MSLIESSSEWRTKLGWGRADEGDARVRDPRGHRYRITADGAVGELSDGVFRSSGAPPGPLFPFWPGRPPPLRGSSHVIFRFMKCTVRRIPGAGIRNLTHLVPPDDDRMTGSPLDEAGKRSGPYFLHTMIEVGPLLNPRPRAV